ncbi:hypothetical protein GCM10009789_08220 [Kribbella sancticallisti]|uniref:DUF3592 domain-containing protein n=1 Tax=Kribbella sancticallisti TaxID=460087 RepID=A0ABN2CGU6_9ACTN
MLDESHGRNARIEVRYATKTGETIEAGTGKYFDAEVGQEIQIVYDPQDPYRLKVADWGSGYWMSAIWLLGGIIGLGVGTAKLFPKPSEPED